MPKARTSAVVATEQALKMAEEAGLDLVEISPNANRRCARSSIWAS
jgi:translation initiation factor IF-3